MVNITGKSIPSLIILLNTFFMIIDDIFSQQVIMTQYYWRDDAGQMTLLFLHLADDDF